MIIKLLVSLFEFFAKAHGEPTYTFRDGREYVISEMSIGMLQAARFELEYPVMEMNGRDHKLASVMMGKLAQQEVYGCILLELETRRIKYITAKEILITNGATVAIESHSLMKL